MWGVYDDSMKALFMRSFVECENVRASYIVCVHTKVRARARSVSLSHSLPISRSLSDTHTHTCTYTRIRTRMHACILCPYKCVSHKHTRTHAYTHTCKQIRTRMHACPYKCAPHERTRARMQACSCADPTPHRILYTNACPVIALTKPLLFFFQHVYMRTLHHIDMVRYIERPRTRHTSGLSARQQGVACFSFTGLAWVLASFRYD